MRALSLRTMLPTVSATPRLAVRVRPGNANHHLWLNHGTWFIHLWFHDGPRKRRLRTSLGTRDLAVARSRRDAVLAALSRRVPTPLADALRTGDRRGALPVPVPVRTPHMPEERS